MPAPVKNFIDPTSLSTWLNIQLPIESLIPTETQLFSSMQAIPILSPLKIQYVAHEPILDFEMSTYQTPYLDPTLMGGLQQTAFPPVYKTLKYIMEKEFAKTPRNFPTLPRK